MAISSPRPRQQPTLVSRAPTASAPSNVVIGHIQLRDLVVCPVERGVVWYVSGQSIVEQDIISSDPRERKLVLLTFTPVTLTALPITTPSGKQLVLLAAGGQEAQLFLALFSYTPRRCRTLKHKVRYGHRDSVSSTGTESTMVGSVDDASGKYDEDHPGHSVPIWQHASTLVGSINNNVMLYIPPERHRVHTFDSVDVSPRLVVSNNDCTVKFFDVCLSKAGLRRSTHDEFTSQMAPSRYWRRLSGASRDSIGSSWSEGWGLRGGTVRVWRYERVGCLRLPVPVNHTSISPDGSTLLSCGDASAIYVHRIMPQHNGGSLVFEQLAKYDIPMPSPSSLPSPASSTLQPEPVPYPPYAFVDGIWVFATSYGRGRYGCIAPPACFSTAWSADGSKFAAASQDGVVRVWDVRSGEPLPCGKWETGQGRSQLEAGESSSGRRRADDWNEQMGGAPPWGVRTLKFAKNASGREVLVCTEHTSFVHIIDADTFETHDVLRIPYIQPGKPRADHRREPRFGQYPFFIEAYPYSEAVDHNQYRERNFATEAPRAHPRIQRLPRRRPERLPPRELMFSSDPNTMRVGLNVDIVNDIGTDSDDETDPGGTGDTHLEPPRVLDASDMLTASPDTFSGFNLRPMSIPIIPERGDLVLVEPGADIPPGTVHAWDPAWDQLNVLDIVMEGAADGNDREARRTALHLLRTGRLRLRAPGHARAGNAQMERDIAFHEQEARREQDGGAVVIPYLQDPGTEEDVRTVLAAHGIAAVTSTLAAAHDQVDSVDADPAELECLLPGGSAEDLPQTSTSQADAATIPPSFSRVSTTSAPSRPSLHSSEPEPEPESVVIPPLPSPPIFSPPQTPFPPPLSLIPPSPSSAFYIPSRRSSSSTLSSSGETEFIPSDLASLGTSRRSATPLRPLRHALRTDRRSAEAPPAANETSQDGSQEQAHAESHIQGTESGGAGAQSQTQTLPPCSELIESTARLDVAGACFDPTGAYMYVATTDGITEWAVQGAERRWWGGGVYV